MFDQSAAMSTSSVMSDNISSVVTSLSVTQQVTPKVKSSIVVTNQHVSSSTDTPATKDLPPLSQHVPLPASATPQVASTLLTSTGCGQSQPIYSVAMSGCPMSTAATSALPLSTPKKSLVPPKMLPSFSSFVGTELKRPELQSLADKRNQSASQPLPPLSISTDTASSVILSPPLTAERISLLYSASSNSKLGKYICVYGS